MKVYRICKSVYARDLSGEGAKIYGGRWNSKGNPVIYTSASKALAVLEFLVNTQINLIPPNLKLITLSIPDNLDTLEYKFRQLSKNWNEFPSPRENSKLGDKWLQENKFSVLKLPSSIIDSEYNYLINPLHKQISKIKIIEIENFQTHNRLIKSLSN